MNIFNLIKKDMIVTFSNKSMLLMIVLYPLFIILVFGSENVNDIFLFTTFAFCHMMTTTPFSYEIKGNTYMFIQSLPLKKIDIIISKYINTIIYFILGTIYSLVYIWIVNMLGVLNNSKVGIETLIFAFIITITASSISLPTQFKFPPKVANFITMMIFIIFFVNIPTLYYSYSNYINLDFSDITNVLLALGISAVISLISMGISIILYKSRKFY